MKTILLSVILLLCVVSLHAQLKLDVAGNARIKGRLDVQSDGTLNIFIGPSSGLNNTDGENNIFIGPVAGFFNTSGSRNTVIGAGAGLINTTGSFNTLFGDEAGRSNIGNKNTFIGSKAGFSNTTGEFNTFIGEEAGFRNTDRDGLVAIGDSALYNNGLGATESYEGINNTAVGSKAGYTNMSGYRNTFLGSVAGYTNMSGYRNTFLGSVAGYVNTSGSDNTFVGAYAGDSNTNGDRNTFLGSAAGLNLQTGSENTFVGGASGRSIQNGSNLIALGYGADANLLSNTPIHNAFTIGNHSLMTASHSGMLGNISTQKITGYVNFATASDGRMKKQVREDVQGLDFILQLRPVTYQVDALKMDRFLRGSGDTVLRSMPGISEEEEEEKARAIRKTYEGYLREKAAIRYTGFIAQEVEEAMSQTDFEFSGLVKPAHEQDHYSLRYAEFVVPLVKATQEQQEIIREQQSQIADLQSTVQNQQQQIDELKDMVNQLLEDRTGESNGQEILPEGEARLHQIVPNPVRRNATIDYEIPSYVQSARLEIHTINGQLLSTYPVSERGVGSLQVKAQNFSAGTYLYSLILDETKVLTRRMVVVK